MPDDNKPIPLATNAHMKVLPLWQAIQQAQRELNLFVEGLKTGMGIPDTWVLNLGTMCFMPPEPTAAPPNLEAFSEE
jgi:hypothetical protein